MFLSTQLLHVLLCLRTDILRMPMHINTIIDNFKDWKGCTLKEIYYAGDDEKYFKEINQQYGGKEAIVLLSKFDVDGSGGDGSLNPNSTYDHWNWLLIKDKHGNWKEVDHGY